MKLSPSSVSSSTSTTTKTSVSELLSFLLKKNLCSKNLPAHPSDQLKEIDPFEYQTSNSMKPQKTHDSATPSLVAKLMGLDSMPDTNNPKICSSITRSKSMNSVNCRVEEAEEMQGNQHMRVKSSVSFMETPSYFELEDDDFFVISFDNGGKNGKPRSRKAKGEMGGRENEQRRRRRGGGKERRPRFKFEESNSEALVLEIENSDQFKSRIGRKKKEKSLEAAKAEIESESENSSPVSVHDHSLFNSDHETPTSEKGTKKRNSSPRRKLASELSNLEQSSSDTNNEVCSEGNDQNPSESNRGKQTGPRRKGGRRRQKREMMNKVVCRLAEAEMAELEWNCNGGLIRNLKNWKAEIGVELGLQIVDQLVDELVHQLI